MSQKSGIGDAFSAIFDRIAVGTRTFWVIFGKLARVTSGAAESIRLIVAKMFLNPSGTARFKEGNSSVEGRMSKSIKTIILGLTGATMLVTAATAGGFSRGTADTDILFEEGNFNMRAGVTVVSPTRKYTAVAPTNLNAVGTDYADTYAVPSASIKFNVTDSFRCAGTLTDVYGGSSTTPLPTSVTTTAKLSEQFTVTEMAATCGYFAPVGKGNFFVLGGGFLEMFNYNLVAGNGALRVNLTDSAAGYRVGFGYEIPEIALRAQLLYRSGTSISATGLANGVLPAFGQGRTPQSMELRAQSGIAPGWLAFGSVKWTDWSVNTTLDLQVPLAAVNSQNVYNWKDGWTYTFGIGHQFNDTFSGAVFASYDTNVGTGFDLSARTITLGSAVTAKGQFGELQLGGAVSFLGAASDVDGNAVGNGIAVAGTASYKIKF